MNEEEHIQKGFNAGYQLQQHDPELANSIQHGFVDQNHPYATGFAAGASEYQKERTEPNLNLSQYLNDNSTQDQDHEKDFER